MNKQYNKLLKLYPIIPQSKFGQAINNIYSRISVDKRPRVNGWHSKNGYIDIISKFSHIPDNPSSLSQTVSQLSSNFLKGAVNWRTPLLQYNVGAAVNVYASAAYAVAMDINIYNINDGLAGNCLASERTVVEIMADLAKVKRSNIAGLFTFGGTATNLYAIKLGLSKALPETRTQGVDSKKIKIFVTEDAHFCHMRDADWLGIGTNNVEVIKADCLTRKSSLADAQEKISNALKKGYIVPIIIINGGTTYSQTIDDIAKFVSLRDKLVKKYSLKYKPHIHVDSVIGWSWLVFNGYDFKKNKLNINQRTLKKLACQYQSISKIKLADSWGVDFHKGIGGCPIDSSLFMINNTNDIAYISRKLDPKIKIHQLATEFSLCSPVDYTLETSRSGGASLSALMMFHTEGLNGLRLHMANLVENISLLEEELNKDKHIRVINSPSNGFVIMVRMYPPSVDASFLEKELNLNNSYIRQKTKDYNNYTKQFFAYDLETRMKKNNSFEYSFSSEYLSTQSNIALSALKFYPTSPHFSKKEVFKISQTLKKQKENYDRKT